MVTGERDLGPSFWGVGFIKGAFVGGGGKLILKRRRKRRGMEVEKQNGAMMIGNNNDCWGCRHNRPSQTEHACCQYGFVISEDEEEEEEEEGKIKDDMEERISQALEVMSRGIVSEERLLTSRRLIDFQGMLKEIIQRWRKETDALTRGEERLYIPAEADDVLVRVFGDLRETLQRERARTTV